jgi:hypothetical protein
MGIDGDLEVSQSIRVACPMNFLAIFALNTPMALFGSVDLEVTGRLHVVQHLVTIDG